MRSAASRWVLGGSDGVGRLPGTVLLSNHRASAAWCGGNAGPGWQVNCAGSWNLLFLPAKGCLAHVCRSHRAPGSCAT